MINYRNFASLNRDIFAWLQQLPRDIDLVVGIPRSGFLVANLLSLYMDIPFTDVDGLLCGKAFQCGSSRYMGPDTTELLSSPRKVLIVDDSVGSGKQMRAIKARIEDAKLSHEILYGAVYMKRLENQDLVDYFYLLLPGARYFEWNVFHNIRMNKFCIDIDGVLCRDPTKEENDDGEMYEHFIQNVEPQIVPRRTIGWLVTCRLEKYRPLTEEWLDRHDIKYKHLIMMDFPNKESRKKSNSYAAFKAEVYKKTDAVLFIESSLSQAVEIARLAGKGVLCMETREIVNPSFVSANYHKWRRFAKRLLEDPREAFRTIKRHLPW